jgi:hypothetical protein
MMQYRKFMLDWQAFGGKSYDMIRYSVSVRAECSPEAPA